MKIMIIEDSPEVVEAISLCFQLKWSDITIATSEGVEGVEMLKVHPYDLVLLDINLPDLDGFQILQQIRSFSSIPVIIITVRGKEEDQARGLEMGADDYIVKPFRPRELIARVNVILSHTYMVEGRGPHAISRGKLTLNLTNNQVSVGDLMTKLTPTESVLLYAMMKKAGTAIDSTELLQEVWGKECNETELLRAHIRRLRVRLKDNPPRIILAERGQGYKFVAPE